MRILPIEDAASPSATPGAVFTASIGTKQIVPQGKFLDSLVFGLKGAVATAAVVIETFVGLLSEYALRVGDKTRLQLAFDELIALSAWFYNKMPRLWENTDATGNDFIFDVRVPVHESISAERPLYHSATRTAQTNIATETLLIAGKWTEAVLDRKPISAIRIPYTTAAAAGYTMMGITLPPIGKLIGLIVKQVAEFADGDIDLSVQRVKIYEDGEVSCELNVAGGSGVGPFITDGTLSPLTDLLKDFHAFDFRDEPIDLKAKKVELAIETQDVSDAVVIIPVIELE